VIWARQVADGHQAAARSLEPHDIERAGEGATLRVAANGHAGEIAGAATTSMAMPLVPALAFVLAMLAGDRLVAAESDGGPSRGADADRLKQGSARGGASQAPAQRGELVWMHRFHSLLTGARDAPRASGPHRPLAV